jgi:HAD superfamily hydrolase (TIGR01509 family)
MSARDFMAGRSTALDLIIFDCDGVLVDSEPVANRVTAEVITAEGWAITAEEAERRFIGLNLEAMVPIVEERLGRKLAADWVARLTDQLVDTLGRESTAIPHVIPALRAIDRMGLPWRVASNSSHEEMAAKFACIGISDLVAGRIHSYLDVPRGKPAPDLFLAAAAAEGIAPAGCVVVEDSITGVRAAMAAGMPCLGYAPSGTAERLRAEGAMPFTSMAELPQLIAAAPRRST